MAFTGYLRLCSLVAHQEPADLAWSFHPESTPIIRHCPGSLGKPNSSPTYNPGGRLDGHVGGANMVQLLPKSSDRSSKITAAGV